MLHHLLISAIHSRWFILWSVAFRAAWPDGLNVYAAPRLPPPPDSYYEIVVGHHSQPTAVDWPDSDIYARKRQMAWIPLVGETPASATST